MGKYLLKRLGQTILVMFLVSILVFLLMSFIPGDPVYAMLGRTSRRRNIRSPMNSWGWTNL